MQLLTRLEQKLGHLAIPNLTIGIIAVQALAWAATLGNPTLYQGMVLDSQLVLAGEWWRVFTFVMLPPASNAIWLFFALYLLYLMGTALENEWGDFRYNLYWGVGWLAGVGSAFLAPGGAVSNFYLDASIFLAFAFLFPNFEILLFFILPVKVKWLAAITWALFILMAVGGIGTGSWQPVAMVAAATLNFFLFFGADVVRRMGQGHRQMQRRRQSLADESEPLHRCSVCKKTDLSDPREDFRYTNVGDEVVCFCSAHLPAE